jgi:hypothetical protein
MKYDERFTTVVDGAKKKEFNNIQCISTIDDELRFRTKRRDSYG